MGYDTKFSGALKLSRALTLPEAAFILEVNEDPDTIPTGDRPAQLHAVGSLGNAGSHRL